MSFNNTIRQWLQSTQVGDVQQQLLNQAGNTAITIPPSGSFSPGPKSGWIRIKQNTLGTNGQVKCGQITAIDAAGQNVANIYGGDRHYSTNSQFYDTAHFFSLDWEVANLNLNVWTWNSNSTFDIEIVGQR